jgi:hypothetical protein
LPDIVAEVTAAFERHGTLSSVANAGTLDARLRRCAVQPAHLAGVIREHKENIKARWAENELCRLDFRDDVQFPGSLNSSRKAIIPRVAKRFRSRAEINDWRRL